MSGTLLAILLAAGGVLYYATSCLFWPYATCFRCKGNSRHRAWWGGGFRMCGRCAGTGRRLRFGRQAFNYFSSKRKDAS